MPAASGASSASMNTSNSFSSSWLGSSPSRQSPVRHSPQRNGLRSSRGSLIPDSYESPTRKLQLEFTSILSHSDREFHKKLDQDSAERAKLHNEQLARAAKEHQRVMEEATREMERIKLEEETERLRKAAVQEKELQRLKEQKMKEEAAAQQRQLEAKLREEQVAREAAEKQRRIQEAAERAKAQKEQEEAARRKKEEEERKAKEAAAAPPPPVSKPQPARAISQPPPAPAVAAATSAPAPATSSGPSADIVEVHKKYLALHGSMKQFRKQFLAAHKAMNDPLKPFVGEIRRTLNKRMGQITVDVEDSRAAIKSIREECFDQAIKAGGPTIDIRPYLISHQIANDNEAQYPQLLLYTWIMFEKYLIHQWYNEAAKEDGRIIGQLALIAASLYLDPKYMCQGNVPMTDTLLAKLHRICPILFGIRGNPQTDRAGLGLDKIHPNEADMNRYSQLMTGVGAGYAALTHRKFSGRPPAIPISEYWRAVVCICNVPADALYPGHFLTLQGLLRDNARKFLLTYGKAAKAVLRRATFDLPNRVPEARSGVKEARPGLHAAASLVKVLPDVWVKKDQIDIRQ